MVAIRQSGSRCSSAADNRSLTCWIYVPAAADVLRVWSHYLMKSCHNRSLNVVWRICAAAILCVAAGASAQSIHKQVDSDGRITYTDRPETTPLPRAATVSDSDVVSALARHAAMTSMSAAIVDFNEATRRLVRARQSRQEGLEPRFGENTDAAGVRMMNERYQRDRQRLEREVVAAQRRSNETSLARSALLRIDARTYPLKLAQP